MKNEFCFNTGIARSVQVFTWKGKDAEWRLRFMQCSEKHQK
jgi:hypothetical protein